MRLGQKSRCVLRLLLYKYVQLHCESVHSTQWAEIINKKKKINFKNKSSHPHIVKHGCCSGTNENKINELHETILKGRYSLHTHLCCKEVNISQKKSEISIFSFLKSYFSLYKPHAQISTIVKTS
jgi:hypothetical protein